MTDSKYSIKNDDIQSMNLNQDTINKLKQLLPEVFTEGEKPVLDIEKLKILLGESVDIEADNKTRYSFNWSGKKQAQAEANKPSGATLRPSTKDSKNCDTTENVYNEGDNLEVLKLLQKSYYGQVKMIYIDPPYNTGKDFVYRDNYHDNVKNYLQLTGQVDNDGNKVDTNTDKNGRFHTDWLNMIYPRLKLARNLLRDDGVIFISIDDNEVHNLRKICDEIFGEDNFVGEFIWKNKLGGGNDASVFVIEHEYLLVYAKNVEVLNKFTKCNEDNGKYVYEDEYLQTRGKFAIEALYRSSISYSASLFYPVECPDGSIIYPNESDINSDRHIWRWSKETLIKKIKEGRVLFKKTVNGWRVFSKQYFNEDDEGNPRLLTIRSIIDFVGTRQGTEQVKNIFENRKIFENPKPITLLQHLIKIVTSNYLMPSDIILDFFSGSATTAHAVMQLNADDGGNRKYICVQLPEATKLDSEAYKAGYKDICEIGKERIRRAGDKILTEYNAKQQHLDLLARQEPTNPLDIGFRVFRLDTSNFKPFDANHLFTDNVIVDGRSSLDVFYELVLKQGYSLDLGQSMLNIGGTQCYCVGKLHGLLVLAVLDDEVKSDFALKLFEYEVKLVIIRDSCFINDGIKLNTLATIEQLESKDNPIQIRII
ncbi:MAG: site-specific DNA-methyltransferase [Burkholderiales bacterium]|nr:site-specific DNA-methyltransferase [Burkholderiales bacterium]